MKQHILCIDNHTVCLQKSKSKKDTSSQKPITKTVSNPSVTGPKLTTHTVSDQRTPNVPAVQHIPSKPGAIIAKPSSGRGGASPSESKPFTTPERTRKVVESSRSSKKAKDTDEKKGNIFSRWRQKHKSPSKTESAAANESGISTKKELSVVDDYVHLEEMPEMGVDKEEGKEAEYMF